MSSSPSFTTAILALPPALVGITMASGSPVALTRSCRRTMRHWLTLSMVSRSARKSLRGTGGGWLPTTSALASLSRRMRWSTPCITAKNTTVAASATRRGSTCSIFNSPARRLSGCPLLDSPQDVSALPLRRYGGKGYRNDDAVVSVELRILNVS